MQSLTLYGIKNCDTVTKARKWLTEQAYPFDFYDYKKDPVTPELITQFLQHFSLDILINKRGTTWRQLTEEQRMAAQDRNAAIELIIANPSLIKRPILSSGDKMIIGFKPELFSQFLEVSGHD